MIKKFAVIMVLAAVSLTQAQWLDSDGAAVLDIAPQFKYYPSDDVSGTVDQYGNAITAGSVTYVSAGPNGVVDSADNSTRSGDDSGLISLLLSVADDSIPVTAALPPFADGVAWGAPTGFNGSVQLQGTAVTAAFLPASETETVVFRLPADLGIADFTNADGVVSLETGQNDMAGVAGRTLFADLTPGVDTVGDGALFLSLIHI